MGAELKSSLSYLPSLRPACAVRDPIVVVVVGGVYTKLDEAAALVFPVDLQVAQSQCPHL